ncbi:MAG: peptide chain release factor N(5)-glutamine methyltransferase [Monoglobales bacterium]
MVKISQLIYDGSEKLKSVSDNPRGEARILTAHALSLSHLEIFLKLDEPVPDDKVKLYESYISQRQTHKPIAYIIGEKEFFGLSFFVNEHTLIPRPETEILVETALASGGKTLLDLCTGSGCIPVSAVKNGLLSALGIDVSEGSIQTAIKNAERHNLSESVSFEACDIFAKDHFGKFDIITSNPPYITDSDMLTLPPDVADFEPHIALSGGADGLNFYRRITEIAPRNLNPNGVLIFEVGVGESDAVAVLMSESFTDIKITKDLAGIDRTVSGKLKEKLNV